MNPTKPLDALLFLGDHYTVDMYAIFNRFIVENNLQDQLRLFVQNYKDDGSIVLHDIEWVRRLSAAQFEFSKEIESAKAVQELKEDFRAFSKYCTIHAYGMALR